MANPLASPSPSAPASASGAASAQPPPMHDGRPSASPSHLDDAANVAASSSDEPSSDSNNDDDPLFQDADDARSLFQPAISPAATRLTSPKTPAAEKAAAMEKLPGGGFFGGAMDGPSALTASGHHNSHMPTSRKLVKPAPNRQNRGFSLGQLPPAEYEPLPRLPSPWQPGPKDLVIQNGSSSAGKPAMSSVFGVTRPRRSSSSGNEALRKLKDALPNITLPTHFLSSLKSPSFFSDSSSQKSPNPTSKQILPGEGADSDTTISDGNRGRSLRGQASLHPPSASAKRPKAVRRSTSDESMLYHSLSRMSSLGDDDRWGHVSEQANVRFKAIKESFDRPTFKMPQLPQALKRHSLLGSETVHNKEPAATTLRPSGSFPKDAAASEFGQALEMLTGDVVVMGGYRGSILRSTRTNRQVWVPVKVGLNIRKVNLEVGLDPEDEERMEETIYPSGMLTNIGPVDISKRLFKRLRECENAKNGKLRVWDYGWDWRLSPHILSRKLISFLEQLPSNQSGNPEERGATVIAHSLGGLITRHAINQRPELFAGVLFAGTPQRCINILGPIRNGDAVLLNEKVLTAQVNFSLRTSFAFLPEDGFCFVNKNTGEEFPIDFYNPEEWAKHALSPCVGPILPAYNVRPSALNSLLNLSGSLPNLPMRSRGNSSASELTSRSPVRQGAADAARKAELHNDHTLAPQMGNMSGQARITQQQQQQAEPKSASERERYMSYLERTLRETKRFRVELHHQPQLTESNRYPPMAVIYGKDIPTVYAAHVTNRDAIPCSDCYDELLFRSGDGVVLSREAMLPPGYDVVNGGRISTDRGHITMLGDLPAVGNALQAILRGRQKGIGLGSPLDKAAHDQFSPSPSSSP